MSEWATHQDELSRKALSVLDDRCHKHIVDGSLTERELKLITDALYDTVTGLVPWEVAEKIAEVQKELQS